MSEQALIDLAVIIGFLMCTGIGWWFAKVDSRDKMPQGTLVAEPFTHVRIVQTNDVCPVCNEDGIEGDSFDYEGNTEVTQGMWCHDCGAEWLDVYTLNMRMLHPVRL